MTIAAVGLAMTAQAADDLNVQLTKLNNTQLTLNSWITHSNGYATHRFVLFGPETPSRSVYVTPLNTTAAYIVAGSPKLGTPTWVGGSGGGGGGGGGKLNRPVENGGNIISRNVTQKDGINIVRTVTQNENGSITMTMTPEGSNALMEQQNPMGPDAGNATIVVTESGGPSNGRYSYYNVRVPFLTSGTITVTHNFMSGSYNVTSYSVTVGGASISCDGSSLSIGIDWFNDANKDN